MVKKTSICRATEWRLFPASVSYLNGPFQWHALYNCARCSKSCLPEILYCYQQLWIVQLLKHVSPLHS
jgi:hypothetical protein